MFTHATNSLTKPLSAGKLRFFPRALSSAMPTVKPDSPNFGSGPCKKRPGWTPDALSNGALGRSHRSALGKAKLKEAIEISYKVTHPGEIVLLSPGCASYDQFLNFEERGMFFKQTVKAFAIA